VADHAGRIVVSGLTKVFGTVKAVHDLSYASSPDVIAFRSTFTGVHFTA
jgi:hypothetical protein